MHFSTQRDIQIMNLYKSKGINSVSQLTIENIANTFNVHVEYNNFPSKCFYDDDFAVIHLNKEQELPYIRKDFFHELSHYLFHYGNQQCMYNDFRKLQEEQANRMTIYTSMPRHIFEPLMLQYRSIKLLTELFELPESMIFERIEMFKQERQLKYQQQALLAKKERLRRKSLQPGKVYDSTIKVLKQLASQVGEEKLSYEVKRLLR